MSLCLVRVKQLLYQSGSPTPITESGKSLAKAPVDDFSEKGFGIMAE